MTNNTTTYRSILAIAARYSDRFSLIERIDFAVTDYCDDPSTTPEDRTQLAHDTLTFFYSI